MKEDEDPLRKPLIAAEDMRRIGLASTEMIEDARRARIYVPDPSKARAARTFAKHQRWAQEMRESGWTVEEPSDHQGD
jgi:hypothetical protein